jgi:hypothetical protein
MTLADRAVVSVIERHTNLLSAIAVLCLCAWGIVTQHTWFVLGILGVGAVAYTLGATLALMAGLALTLLGIRTEHGFNLTLTTTLFEFVGYMLVARLGFKHRQQQAALRRQRQTGPSHRDRVIPWHVSNDIRTSLAAVRFLLFPVNDGQHGHAVEEAVKELARLERLFQEMEEDQQPDTDKQAPTH